MATYAGLDVSTQSAKILLVDGRTRRRSYFASVNYDRDLPEYHTRNGACTGLGDGVSESDPLMWLKAVEVLFERMVRDGVDVRAIRAISVSGQQHGLVCLDEAGNLTRARSKLWNDSSTVAECDELTRKIGGVRRMVREVSNSQRTGYTAGKILHFARRELGAYRRTRTLFLVHNYVNWYLTGGVRAMEPGDTSGMALWNPATRRWSRRLCDAISRDLSKKLPPVGPSDAMIGTISRPLAGRFGFDPSCRIAAGSGDNMMGAIGTGNVTEGVVTVSLGTSGTAYAFLKKPYVDPEGEIACFCDATGNYLALLCVSNLANGYESFLRKYKLAHADFERILLETPPGNGGRILIPWFGGERTPDLPDAAPLAFGFALEDLDRKRLCRAVLEGHVMHLYEGFLKLPVRARQIRITGGLSKSGAWRQAIADIFGAEVVRADDEAAALGAAIHAAWIDLKAKDLRAFVEPFLGLGKAERRRPVAANVKRYEMLKKAYIALSRRIRGLREEADPFALRKALMNEGERA